VGQYNFCETHLYSLAETFGLSLSPVLD